MNNISVLIEIEKQLVQYFDNGKSLSTPLHMFLFEHNLEKMNDIRIFLERIQKRISNYYADIIFKEGLII